MMVCWYAGMREKIPTPSGIIGDNCKKAIKQLYLDENTRRLTLNTVNHKKITIHKLQVDKHVY